ncbi:hypothetical protein M427DRAFT_52830 [Gonapodya prolifera JEL478]|uniref:Uncharacterized protein n=1 Tax=Gonapodya prolifera (strain JEL478) TaxID=1344416 RepID=A0A139ARW6_GONPJ|nr:hypothetical protein M427DRAFT_52830 [Gonapodya prolifera JEL478]|eukprot:KXS19394.1 hypothetical protein M427DRAFT_52830 [Gonapodya prolifera JEL478]
MVLGCNTNPLHDLSTRFWNADTRQFRLPVRLPPPAGWSQTRDFQICESTRFMNSGPETTLRDFSRDFERESSGTALGLVMWDALEDCWEESVGHTMVLPLPPLQNRTPRHEEWSTQFLRDTPETVPAEEHATQMEDILYECFPPAKNWDFNTIFGAKTSAESLDNALHRGRDRLALFFDHIRG